MSSGNDNPVLPGVSVSSLPEAPTAIDRLSTIFRSAGPFTTVYLITDTLAGNTEPIDSRWAEMRTRLSEDGAPQAALDAIEARLQLPTPGDTSAVCVIASADGTTVVDHGQEPLHHDLAVFDTLPYAAPLLEWDQRRVSHLLVTVDDAGADIALFGLDHFTKLVRSDRSGSDLADDIGRKAAAVRAELIVISGEPGTTGELMDHLASILPVHCRVVAEPAYTDVDDLVDAAVRHLSDVVARATVLELRELRFLESHGKAVDGRKDTVHALAHGTAERLLIHDDPADQERIWVSHGAHDLSTSERSGFHQARAVDALIRSAVMQEIPIWIIPSTQRGPEDDTAAVVDDIALSPLEP